MQSMLALFDIVEVAAATERDPEDVLKVYFRLGSRLDLNWLRERIIELPRANRWQALARAALRDDLFNLYRELTRKVLDDRRRRTPTRRRRSTPGRERNGETLERVLGMVADIRASRIYDNTTLPVGPARDPQPCCGATSRTGAPGRVGHDGRVSEPRAACRCAARQRAYAHQHRPPRRRLAARRRTPAARSPGGRQLVKPRDASYRLANPQMADTVTTTVTELPESRVRVQAQVAPEEVERRIQQAARELGRQMRVPGFRKGKVPPPVVIRRLGREAVLDEALRERARHAGTPTRSTAPGSRRWASPSSTSSELPAEGQPLQFSIEIGVRPAAKLGQYKGLEVGRREPQVEDDADRRGDRAAARPPGHARDRRAPRRRTATTS